MSPEDVGRTPVARLFGVAAGVGLGIAVGSLFFADFYDSRRTPVAVRYFMGGGFLFLSMAGLLTSYIMVRSDQLLFKPSWWGRQLEWRHRSQHPIRYWLRVTVFAFCALFGTVFAALFFLGYQLD